MKLFALVALLALLVAVSASSSSARTCLPNNRCCDSGTAANHPCPS